MRGCVEVDMAVELQDDWVQLSQRERESWQIFQILFHFLWKPQSWGML